MRTSIQLLFIYLWSSWVMLCGAAVDTVNLNIVSIRSGVRCAHCARRQRRWSEMKCYFSFSVPFLFVSSAIGFQLQQELHKTKNQLQQRWNCVPVIVPRTNRMTFSFSIFRVRFRCFVLFLFFHSIHCVCVCVRFSLKVHRISLAHARVDRVDTPTPTQRSIASNELHINTIRPQFSHESIILMHQRHGKRGRHGARGCEMERALYRRRGKWSACRNTTLAVFYVALNIHKMLSAAHIPCIYFFAVVDVDVDVVVPSFAGN